MTTPRSPSDSRELPPAEVMNEYGIIMVNSASVGARRQTMNDVYVGLNVVFLSALGYFPVSSHPNSWGNVFVAFLVSAAVLPVNWAWYASILRYRAVIQVHSDAMRDIERRYQFAADLNLRLDKRPSTTDIERNLARYFIVLYPLIALIVAVPTFLTVNHWIASPL